MGGQDSCPPIAAAVLQLTPQRSLLNAETFGETFGLLLESSCVHDLRVYGGALGGSIFHTATGRDHSQVVATREARGASADVGVAGEVPGGVGPGEDVLHEYVDDPGDEDQRLDGPEPGRPGQVAPDEAVHQLTPGSLSTEAGLPSARSIQYSNFA